MGNQQKEIKGNLPEKKFRAGSVTGTVWVNAGKDKQENEVQFKTVRIERNYLDKDEKWQQTSTFRVNDLPKVALVATKAFEYLASKEE